MAQRVVTDAEIAGRRIRKSHGWLSLQNIRRYLVAFAVAVFAWWGYTNYLQSRVVRVAVTAGDFAVLSAQVEKNNARDIVFVETPGSPANLEAVRVGEVDMAVAQAGIPLPDDLSILGIVRREHVLYFEREPRTDADVPPVVMTFVRGKARTFWEPPFSSSGGARMFGGSTRGTK